MREYFAYDRVLKDLFQTDRPTMLELLTGGVRVKEFLNVEFPRVMEWRADLVAMLEDGTIFHFEIQGQNDEAIGYRKGIYGLLIAERHRRGLRQTVLYVGAAPMDMKSRLDVGEIQVSFRLIDIRDFDAEELLRSHSPGDLALAMLAKGGTDHLSEIALLASKLTGKARTRVLTQLILLSGLRQLSGKLRMEMKNMGSLQIDLRDNEILREVWDEVMVEGKAEGKAEGLQTALRWQLQAKFGSVPAWAETRLENANPRQLETWLKQVLSADTIESVLVD